MHMNKEPKKASLLDCASFLKNWSKAKRSIIEEDKRIMLTAKASKSVNLVASPLLNRARLERKRNMEERGMSFDLPERKRSAARVKKKATEEIWFLE